MNAVECPKGGFCRWAWAPGINGSRYRYCEKCGFVDKVER